MDEEQKRNQPSDYDDGIDDIDMIMRRRRNEEAKRLSSQRQNEGDARVYRPASSAAKAQSGAAPRSAKAQSTESAAVGSAQGKRQNADASVLRRAPSTASRPSPQGQGSSSPARSAAPRADSNMPPQSRPSPSVGQMGQRPSVNRARQNNAAPLTPHNPANAANAVNSNEEKNRDNSATRKTDLKLEGREKEYASDGEKKEKKEKKKKAKKKETPAEIGSSLVTGMLKTVIYIAIVTVIASVLSIFIINYANDIYAFVKSDEVVDVTIPENATIDDIADVLYENGVIKYKSVFKMYGKKNFDGVTFIAGDYSVTPMMNYKSLYNEFREKPVSGTTRITIPEGYTVDEIIELMLSYGIGGSKEEYVDAINNYDYDYWFVKELDGKENPDRFYRLEGYLFPDTYEFYNASSAVTVIERFLERFEQVYVDGYRERAEEMGLTTDEVVILASMIEKEAGMSSDYRNVSSVFHNRMNNSATFPKFESDATAVYAIHHLQGERPTDVTGETISFDSPYNTYLNNGFPPGAIANPGINAIKYALYPAETNYFYFVSSKNGETLFASTAAEHEANKARIRG